MQYRRFALLDFARSAPVAFADCGLAAPDRRTDRRPAARRRHHSATAANGR